MSDKCVIINIASTQIIIRMNEKHGFFFSWKENSKHYAHTKFRYKSAVVNIILWWLMNNSAQWEKNKIQWIPLIAYELSFYSCQVFHTEYTKHTEETESYCYIICYKFSANVNISSSFYASCNIAFVPIESIIGGIRCNNDYPISMFLLDDFSTSKTSAAIIVAIVSTFHLILAAPLGCEENPKEAQKKDEYNKIDLSRMCIQMSLSRLFLIIWHDLSYFHCSTPAVNNLFKFRRAGFRDGKSYM